MAARAAGQASGTAGLLGIPIVCIAIICAACEATVRVPASANGGVPPAALFGAPTPSARAAPLPSPGCRLPPAQRTRAELAGGTIDRRLSSGGHQRRFLLAVPEPAAADAGRPIPLVLNLHGLLETPEEQQLLSRMQPLALARGWAIAWPEGLGASWNAGACCGRARAEGSDDVRFLRDLVAQLGRELCLDLRRVYATGMSNGGFMSYRLGCEASDLFAAVAPVAATEGVERCAPKRPVALLAVNGTKDLLVPLEGRARDDFPSVKESFDRWRTRNGCAPDADRTLYQNGDATCLEATACPRSADVVFCAIEGGGHTWPGGMLAPYLGHTSSDLDASSAILDFFAAHARE